MTHASIAGPIPHARPQSGSSGYRLPRAVYDRLLVALAGRRNAGKAMALALFLGRFWSAPARLGRSFPVDRRQLADRPDLGLSEEEVRGATATLEDAGFLVREAVQGSAYRPTPEGHRRKPILRRFGPDFFASFVLANEPSRRRARQQRPVALPHKGIFDGSLMGDQVGSPLEQALSRWKGLLTASTSAAVLRNFR